MCLAAAALPYLSLGLSAVGTGAGIIQSQQQAAQQRAAANQNLQIQHMNAQRAAYAERQAQIAQYTANSKAHHEANLTYQQQVQNNADAANRVYVQEQTKMSETRAKAAFRAQEIYAKSIGAQGRVLASGAVGQSVGLMAMDAERQAGFSLAEQNASVRSAQNAAAVAMEGGYLQNRSANNQAYSRLPAAPQHPTLAQDPVGIGPNLNLGIPTYNWG